VIRRIQLETPPNQVLPGDTAWLALWPSSQAARATPAKKRLATSGTTRHTMTLRLASGPSQSLLPIYGNTPWSEAPRSGLRR